MGYLKGGLPDAALDVELADGTCWKLANELSRADVPFLIDQPAGPVATIELRGAMTLNFSNESRSYDATRRAVRFWGYDGSREVSFFATEDALHRLQPGVASDELSLLSAFSAHRDRVYAAAARVYARGRKGSYEIWSGDL